MVPFLNKLYKFSQLGITRGSLLVQSRIQSAWFAQVMRTRALQKKASFTWDDLVQRECINPNFQLFWQQCSTTSYEQLDLFFALFSVEEQRRAIEHAQSLINTYTIFTTLPVDWHGVFPRTVFYRDIQIPYNYPDTDIRLVWERARLHDIVVMGYAYQCTADPIYMYWFQAYLESWIDANPYLLGINWVCPMEVSIRIISLVWAFYFFKNSTLSKEFWQTFVCCVYNHVIYLQYNWEIYDGRTNNHYLANLVGYLYGCWFFNYLHHMRVRAYTTYTALLAEIQRQIYTEGTSYEGSTQYHAFVTELVYHAYYSARFFAFPVNTLTSTLERATDFIYWCTDLTGSLVAIGDSDSGRVLFWGLPHAVYTSKTIAQQAAYYPQFGISCLKTHAWHCTLRHHAYTLQQPSGHFHSDIGSITLSYKNIQLIVDPGTYIYTSSVNWRNYFRAHTAHNSFWIQEYEPVALSVQPFYLAIPESNYTQELTHATSMLTTTHTLYQDLGLQAYRTVQVYQEQELDIAEIVITDRWQGQSTNNNLTSVWQFTFAPHIQVIREHDYWCLYLDIVPVFYIYTNINFTVISGWISSRYGTKEKTTCLRGYAPLISNYSYITRIHPVQKHTVYYGI